MHSLTPYFCKAIGAAFQKSASKCVGVSDRLYSTCLPCEKPQLCNRETYQEE